MQMLPLPASASIPYLTPTLHNVLAPRLQGQGLQWLKGPGDCVEDGEVIAQFDLAWKRKDLKTVDPSLVDQVRHGSIRAPWPGVIQSGPSTAGGLFRFVPTVRSDWLVKGTEGAVDSVRGYVTASRAYKITSQTIWMVLRLDHGSGSNDFINRELDIMDANCSVNLTGMSE